jgi:hypothetical protein
MRCRVVMDVGKDRYLGIRVLIKWGSAAGSTFLVPEEAGKGNTLIVMKQNRKMEI